MPQLPAAPREYQNNAINTYIVDHRYRQNWWMWLKARVVRQLGKQSIRKHSLFLRRGTLSDVSYENKWPQGKYVHEDASSIADVSACLNKRRDGHRCLSSLSERPTLPRGCWFVLRRIDSISITLVTYARLYKPTESLLQSDSLDSTVPDDSATSMSAKEAVCVDGIYFKDSKGRYVNADKLARQLIWLASLH